MLCYPDVTPSNVKLKSNGSNIDYSKLIKRIRSLLPIDCKDKQMALEEIISYVTSMLYGDDLHRFCTYKYCKRDVIDAFDELIKYVQENSLIQYKEQVEELKEEINNYLTEKEQYKNEISELKKEKESLQSQVNELKKEKKLLSDENNDIKNSINKYSEVMNKQSNNNEVIWETIKKGDPIYGISRKTIDSYISRLEQAYMAKLGVSNAECKNDFVLNSSGIYELRNFLSSFEHEDASIGYLLESTGDLSFYEKKRARVLSTLMENIKVPKIKEHKSTLPAIDVTNNSGNINNMLRELQYQKIAYEALAKQKIAETQLNSLIMSLKEIVPENYDLSQYTEIIDEEPIKQLLEK